MFSGQRLKEIREAQGMSQASVAKHLGISRSSYFNWENGKTKPNQKNLSVLAELFGVAETYFLSEHEIVEVYLELNEENRHDFASWVFGDSMEPTYLNGEVVLIKQTGFDYDGAVYAVDWDGQTYIKKVYREEDGLRLVSLNKRYGDKFAPYDEDPRIIGKIVGNFMPVEA